TILFPSSFFDVCKVDEDLQAEYDAVQNTGLYDVILFGYEKWFHQGKLVLTTEPAEAVNAVYRGWMMKPDLYETFYKQLKEHGICLVTEPDMYANMHVFPNVYKLVENDTAKMKVFPLHEEIDIEDVKKEFSRFMVKDYVKSVKGTEFPAYFDHVVDQSSFDQWMEVFYKYRGDLLTGGICIKEYLDLKKYGDRTNEFRVFYINHEIAAVSRNSSQLQVTADLPRELVEKYRNLPSVFYTVDFAELADGTWKIIEAGDGEVSGLSDGQDYEAFFRALYHCFA
ncbi:MAG: ATP-grasp domain-containing protein, partial [Lachnospiraceae bacterium]|nr:ATP-grasp domain-containing protein [Lachnospiraceae bacterium]